MLLLGSHPGADARRGARLGDVVECGGKIYIDDTSAGQGALYVRIPGDVPYKLVPKR